MLDEKGVVTDITNLRRDWKQRNDRFREWYEFLTLVDNLKTKGMESYISNEPQTFYNMAHYLLTKGELSHSIPIETESAMELDRRARVNRGCEFLWRTIDRDRRLGGNYTFVDELGFDLLVLGWHSAVIAFDNETGLLKAQLWSPFDTYPRYSNGRIAACAHSYNITGEDAVAKADANGWSYSPPKAPLGLVTLDDYFTIADGMLYNMILIDSHDVTGWVERPDMELLVAPVGGFPDKGSLVQKGRDWRKSLGRGIFEVNANVSTHFNKWKSQISQILRDTSNPLTQEFSATPQATPEQLRERGALFHYGQGEAGLQRVPPPQLPIEVQANLLEIRRELQKGSFSDAVYGMVEGQPGYALSLLASSSANQILYPYMDGKHFVISECDRFWLSKLKTSKRVFEIKGKFIEKLSPPDIPEDVTIEVESSVATPKDWLERGTIANMVKDQLDSSTIITDIYGLNDPQGIKRRRSNDKMLEHPVFESVEMAAAAYAHADYLDRMGDPRQANLFRKAAMALEGQLGIPPAGSARPPEATRVERQVEEGTPEERTRVASRVSPPEERGFTPAELRKLIGRGSLRAT